MMPTRNAVSENVSAKATIAFDQHYALVWLDRFEARIVHFNSEASHVEIVRPSHAPGGWRIAAESASGVCSAVDTEFYRDVVEACEAADALLLVGHSIAKTEFVKYLHLHSPHVFDRISGIETLARATDALLLAEGRRFFDMAEHRGA